MTAGLVIRPAGPGDVAALRAIAVAAYQKYVARIGRAPAPMSADYAQAVRDGQAWAAVDDGEIAGFVVLVPEPGYLLLENVAVRPAAQGRGIGARLLAQAEDRARDLGLAEIRLYTNEAMTENLAYYARHGYVESHRAEQDGFRRVFFRKRIGLGARDSARAARTAPNRSSQTPWTSATTRKLTRRGPARSTE